MDNRNYSIKENEFYFFTHVSSDYAAQEKVVFTFIVERNASLRAEILCAYGNADIVINCILRGTASQAIVNVVCIGAEQNRISVSTLQHHEAAHTNSTVLVKCLVRDQSLLSFKGMIRVETGAHHSVSLLENKNISLSDTARVVSVPSLEILNHDVKCFHGSATGRFDKDLLFYGAARGIDETGMKRLLLDAFFVDIFKDSDLGSQLKKLVVSIQ